MLSVTNQRKKHQTTTVIPNKKKHIATHVGNRGASERKTVFVQSPNLHKLIGEKDLFTFFYSLDPMRETAGKKCGANFPNEISLFLSPRIKSHCWQ